MVLVMARCFCFSVLRLRDVRLRVGEGRRRGAVGRGNLLKTSLLVSELRSADRRHAARGRTGDDIVDAEVVGRVVVISFHSGITRIRETLRQ